MEAIVREKMERIKFGEIQIHNHVAVFPMIGSNGSGSDYLTMKEAMDGQFLTVTEVTEGGTVPELKVINRGKKPVLLLDGEELSGAKQNRVLNTTILIKEMSETVIPVSCTEHGRWQYRSSHFEESGHIMSAKLRRIKNASVLENLKAMKAFLSDQGAVWDEIAIQAMEAYARMCKAEDLEEIARIRKALLDYCRLDTLAMMRILEALDRLSA